MKKLFFITVLLGTVIFIGVFGFSYFRLKNKTPQAYFETGKAFYDKGKYSEATIEFLNASQRDPKNRDSRYYLALSYLNQGDAAAGIRNLRSLLEFHPDDVPANLQMGRFYLAGGSTNPDLFHQAQETAANVLAKEPQNVEAMVLAGNAFAGLKDLPESVKYLEKAAALDPKNVQAWVSLGSARAQQKNFIAAERAFLNAREADPKNKSALVSLANFYRFSGTANKAEMIFTEALSQYPADREVYSPAVDFYLGEKRYGEVEKVLRAAQDASPGDPAPTFVLSEVYLILKRPEDARKLLLDAKSKFPKDIQLSIKLATNLLADNPVQARQEIDEILKAEPKNPVGHVLLGELQFSSGQFKDAAETLGKEPALGSPFPEVHYLLGSMAFKKGNIEEAQSHYQQSLKVNKDYIPSLVALANLFLAKGRFADAGVNVRHVLELAPRNSSARLLKAVIDSNDKTNSTSEAELSSLAKEFPDNAEIHRQLGLYLASRGKNAEAEKSLARALDLAPTEQSFRDLTVFYLQTKQMDRARQRLNGVPDAQKQAFHYELVGMTAELADKPQDAEIAYKKALEKDPQRLNVESQIFSLYLRTGRLDDALKNLDALAKKSPSNAMVPAMKAQIEAMKGNSKQAEEDYRKALQLDPSIDVAANNLAFLLAEEGRDLQTALSLARGVRQRQPQNPEVADTLGWVYYKLDLPVQAREQALFAVSIQPQNGPFQYHLGAIYRKESKNVEAIKALQKAVSISGNYKEKGLAEAELKELLKSPAAAKH